jgi:tryptophan-rich hypothetical protein
MSITPKSSNRFNSRKLLLSKWTAVSPTNREKHFLVTQVVAPEPPDAPVELIELEAVHSGRKIIMPWRELRNGDAWLQGWL